MKKVLFCLMLLIASGNLFAEGGSSFEATATEIKQGDKVVATYTRKEATLPNQTVEMVMTFKDLDGNVIAVAKIPYQQKGAKTVIKTSRDNKEQTIVLQGRMDTDMATEIATQLSNTK